MLEQTSFDAGSLSQLWVVHEVTHILTSLNLDKKSQNEPQLKVPGIWSILATFQHECAPNSDIFRLEAEDGQLKTKTLPHPRRKLSTPNLSQTLPASLSGVLRSSSFNLR